MRTTRVLYLLAMVVLVAALLGCSSDNIVDPDALTPDQQTIQGLVNQSPEFEHDVLSHSIPDTTAVAAVASAAAAQSYFWWRQYTSTDRLVSVSIHAPDISNPNVTADVGVTTTFNGLFHIVHRDTSGAFTHTTKSLTDVFTQTGRFEQTGLETDPNRGWVNTEITNIVGGTNPTTLSVMTFSILPETHPTHPNVDYTAANFATAYDPADLLVLDQGEQVNLWLQSGTGTNDAFHHDWYIAGASREMITNMDLGFYANQHNAPTALSSADADRYMVLDILAPGVIDGAAGYDALIWAVPYSVDLGQGGGGTPN